MNFGNPISLWLLALVPLVALFLVWAFRARRRALERFAASSLAEKLAASVNRPARAWKAVWLIGIVALVTVALARPQWGFEWKEVKRRGVDVFVVLDVSKSMLAADVKPNRLAQAKFAVEDLVTKLQGDRVGLIAFAGSVFVQCPLTVDYEAFRMTLRDAGPDTIPRGGTAISLALQTALKSFEAGAVGDRAIVLITDGEDTEGDPLAAAAEAAKQSVRVFAIGIGTNAGELIPVRERDSPVDFLKDKEGKVVKSKRNEDALKQIALKTGGIYVRSAAGDFGVDTIYDKGIAQLQKTEHEARLQKRYFERYQWPLGIAFTLLALEMFMTERKRLIAVLVFCLCSSSSFAAENWLLTYNQGVTSYRSNDFTNAATSFEQSTASPDRQLQARAFYNLGNAHYRQGEAAEPQGPAAALPVYEKSLKNFENALAINPADEDAKFNRDVVKKKIEELKKKQEQQEQQQKQPDKQQQEDKEKQQPDQQQQQEQSQLKPEDQKQQPQPDKQQQSDQQQKQQEQQQQQEQKQEQMKAAQTQTNQIDKAQARALLDNLREQERLWNFFPELQMKKGEDTEPEKDW